MPGSLEKDPSKVEYTMFFHSPYMAVGENDYMPIDSCGKKELIETYNLIDYSLFVGYNMDG